MRLAYQGEPGAYSEAAALQFGGSHIETLPCKTFDEGFEAVVKKATHSVVPLGIRSAERSTATTICCSSTSYRSPARSSSTSSTASRRCRGRGWRT